MSGSEARGQFLGYSLQYPRAIYYLLTSREGDSVCIEHLGDVSKVSENKIISEEDKSSVANNPITNKSENLWKTFYNWINLIETENIEISKIHFILFTNKAGNKALVDLFSEVKNASEVSQAVDKAVSVLSDIIEGHSIWKYYNFVTNTKRSIFEKLLLNFEFIVGSDVGLEEVFTELRGGAYVPGEQIDFVSNEISGWLQSKVMALIKSGEVPRIRHEEFNSHMILLLERVRARELFDFTLQLPVTVKDVESHFKVRPHYIKQLDLINLKDFEIVEAISEYLKAYTNRTEWIEREIIDLSTASDFEKRLTEFWKNQKTYIELVNGDMSPEDRGKLLLLSCKVRQETIRGQTPPSSTVAGTYHSLANEKNGVLGWHPDWSIHLTKKKEEED
jgi:hypothetical protein